MAWDVIFCATAEGSVPGADFLDGCPAKVRGTILAVLDKRTLTKRGLGGPAIAVITGMRKKTGTVFSDRDYAKVRRLGSE
ncbi:MAG TPA: hypothetical protein VIH71_11945 [Solirubrobacteraceae bacterium]